jgi:site-specific recombinase XerD
VLRAFFGHLVASDVIERSPAEHIQPPKTEQRERGYLRAHEYGQLLGAAGANPRDFAILTLFLQTGLRLSELCGLTLSDVDLSHEVIHVHGKGNKAAAVPLEAKSIKALARYLDDRGDGAPAALFLNRYGEPLSASGVKKLLKGYVRATELPDWVSCHTLRHTYGTLKGEKGVDPMQLQQLMRHSRLQTTTIYRHHRAESLAKVQKRTSL